MTTTRQCQPETKHPKQHVGHETWTYSSRWVPTKHHQPPVEMATLLWQMLPLRYLTKTCETQMMKCLSWTRTFRKERLAIAIVHTIPTLDQQKAAVQGALKKNYQPKKHCHNEVPLGREHELPVSLINKIRRSRVVEKTSTQTSVRWGAASKKRHVKVEHGAGAMPNLY